MAGDPHDDVTGEIGSGGITGQWIEKATTHYFPRGGKLLGMEWDRNVTDTQCGHI
jgi:hypothetical protein